MEEKKPRKKDDRPKLSPKEDLAYRIKGLEEAKLESGMSRQDIAALDRVIAKLKEKQGSPQEEKKEEV